MGWLDDIARAIEKGSKETAKDVDRIIGRILGEDPRSQRRHV